MDSRRVVSDYNATADMYQERYVVEQDLKIGFLLSRVRPRTGSLVLDVGCGTGMLLERLEGRADCVGIDPSIGMLRVARRRGCRAELVLADANHIPFRTEAFDYVFSVSVLQLLERPEGGAREMLRVLKGKGWLGASALIKVFTATSLKALFGIADGEAYESETMKDAFLLAQKP